MPLKRLNSLSEVSPDEWNALVPEDQPFLRHAFLSALEDSASLGRHSGWQPEHLLHYEGERLVAALPSYRKWHSYGEYVFDHGWADACARAGIEYYPKLLTAVPFSPVSGPRLLVANGADGLELLQSLPGYLEIEAFPVPISTSPMPWPMLPWASNPVGLRVWVASSTGRTAVIATSRTSSTP